MKLVTYLLESEIDFERIVSSLEASRISFTTRKYSDSSFPSISQTKGFAEITVAEEYELELQSLIENLTRTKPMRVKVVTNSGRKRRNVWQIILVAYAIIVTVTCLRYWYLNYRTLEDKHNTFEWSFDGQDLITKRKETGVTSRLDRDANFDQNFELTTSYSKDGIRLAQSKDLNEDGYYEETTFYNLKGQWTGFYFDRDNDGIIEEATMVLEDQDTLKFFDSNKNGVFELKRPTN